MFNNAQPPVTLRYGQKITKNVDIVRHVNNIRQFSKAFSLFPTPFSFTIIDLFFNNFERFLTMGLE